MVWNNIANQNYNPMYIIKEETNRFGGQQDDYLKKSEEIINETSNRIISARENEEDLDTVFFEILKN